MTIWYFLKLHIYLHSDSGIALQGLKKRERKHQYGELCTISSVAVVFAMAEIGNNTHKQMNSGTLM